MKKISNFKFQIALFLCLLLPPALAEGQYSIKITLLGINSHAEYQEIIGSLKKTTGVTDLIPAKEKRGFVELSGRLESDPLTFINDVQAFALDRFKFEKKGTQDRLEITLKKL